MKVVVFGASGTIGQPLLAELARAHDVVAVSRREQAAREGVIWKTADASQRDSVARVLEGCDVAYYLVHSLGSADFEALDLRAAETTALAAENAGVKQFVYLGGLGDDSADLSPHLRSRRETGAHLASTSVPVTTLRAAMVIGRGSAAFETIVALVDRLPAMVTPRWVSTRTQPIALSDIVAYLAGVCGLEAALGSGIRRRRAGGDDLPRNDGTNRRSPRKATFHLRGPCPDAVPLLVVVARRDAGEGGSGASAHRRTAKRDRRSRRANSRVGAS